MKNNPKKVPLSKIRIFKITNRKGYAALCMNNLTEGPTVLQVYQRMIKAVKRSGYELPELSAVEVKKLMVAKA